MVSPKHIRIFLSSPGDVASERALALEAIERLPYDPLLRGKITVEVIAWDKPGAGTVMLASLSPQEAVYQGLPKPSECDIVVVMFWARMGTPLLEEYVKPEAYRFPTGTTFPDWRYLSGTEWEYIDAIQGAKKQGLPYVTIYKRTEKILLDPSSPNFTSSVEQWQRVEAFFKTFTNPDGSIRQGFNSYETPDKFRELFEFHLRDLVNRLLEREAKQPVPVEIIPPPFWSGSPFPGLRAFTPDDKPIFFGRGRETDALLKRVSEQRFVAVVGASGSGKSSLVGAGLIPRLADNAIPGSKDWLLPHMQGPEDRREWAGLRFTPGDLSDNPFTSLASRLASLLEGANPRELADTIAADPGALCAICEQALIGHPDWAELLLFIDQFEELFTVVRPEYRAPFIDWLAYAATTNRLRTILTVRADFYHRCLEYPRLAKLLQESLPLAAPELDALLEMIERPAVLAGLKFDQGLPGRILRDTGQEPGALALLAYTLDELYQRAKDDCLTHPAYEALGGVQGAIGTRAESVFARLDQTTQQTLPHVFRELVEVDERGTATRQRAPLARFEGNDAAWTLLGKFTDARLLTTSTSGDGPLIEVSHEALFRSWPRLAAWIETAQDDLRLLRQVRQTVQQWIKNNRRDDFLWTGQRLKEAQQMVARINPRLNEVEEEFLRSEVERLVEKLGNPDLEHAVRAKIGEQLHIIGDTRSGVGLRPDGLPEIIWCPVPSGKITLDEHAGTFTVKPFYIAKYQITFVQFQTFLDAENGFHNPEWWAGLAASAANERTPYDQRFKFSNHPRDSVSWYDAVAFCRWLSAKLPPDGWPEEVLSSPPIVSRQGLENRLLGRETQMAQWTIALPTEWEWQQAATGGNPDNTYPWGPDWEEGCRCNTTESGLSRTTAVGIYLHGVSLVGALDMAGNLYEWTQNEYLYPKNTSLSGEVYRCVRGGSWYDYVYDARCANRVYRAPDLRDSYGGFRVCVVSRPIS